MKKLEDQKKPNIDAILGADTVKNQTLTSGDFSSHTPMMQQHPKKTGFHRESKIQNRFFATF